MDLWKDVETVIILDAAVTGSPPGTVHRFDASVGPLPSAVRHHSTHGFGVAEAIELGRSLNALPPRVLVFGAEARTFDPGSSPSPEIEDAAGRIAEEVMRECRSRSHRRV
jgi:hydrogenase maturation protease